MGIVVLGVLLSSMFIAGWVLVGAELQLTARQWLLCAFWAVLLLLAGWGMIVVAVAANT